jgi:hypothetical protein
VLFFKSPWRERFAEALTAVKGEMVIVSPFVKEAEANFVCESLARGFPEVNPAVELVTDLRAEAVLSGSLDLGALKVFQSALPTVKVITLPHLHAKVYIFDRKLAVVSSANLTTHGLDSNYEYGIGLTDPAAVNRIRRDISSYARLGNLVPSGQVESLLVEANELRDEYEAFQRSATRLAVRRFQAKLNTAKRRFTEAHVGDRSANSIFSEAILHALSRGPLATSQLYPLVQHLLPDLCDNRLDLVINGQRFGKVWQHQVRNAQQDLKRRGLIRLDGNLWRIAGTRLPLN